MKKLIYAPALLAVLSIICMLLYMLWIIVINDKSDPDLLFRVTFGFLLSACLFGIIQCLINNIFDIK